MSRKEPLIVERTDYSLAVVVLAVVFLGILALVTALIVANFDAVRGPDSGSQSNPSNPPTAAPEEPMPEGDGILPPLPAPAVGALILPAR